MKKWVSIGLALVLIALVVVAVRFFAVAPGRIERSQNRIVPVPLGITPAAQALQATLDVADLHADSLLWKRDLLERSDRGHVDLPRLIEGHYALQVFSSVTKSPDGQNYDSNGADRDTSGLTPLGRQAVHRMEALGMIVDVAHASHAAVADVLAMATRPVVSSHGGVQATCKVNRNLTDDEVGGIAKTGGVVGIGFW